MVLWAFRLTSRKGVYHSLSSLEPCEGSKGQGMRVGSATVVATLMRTLAVVSLMSVV
jgi:hypothetical protein